MNHFNYFDYKYYINKYDKLSKFNEEQALNHFKKHGIKEHRKFNKLLESFDYKFYITKYGDLSKLNYLEACNHYIRHGIKEKRICCAIKTVNNYLCKKSDFSTDKRTIE